MTIDGTKLAILIRPLVPDTHAVVLQVLDIGIALEEPQQLVDDGLEVELLGSQEREALLEVKTHLMTEDRDSACTCTVVLLGTLGEYALAEIEILFHCFCC